jgi:hypothetical protein
MDILVTNNNGVARLLLNQTAPHKQHWLTVKLQGVQDNSQGLGARVALLRDGLTQWRRAHTDGSYLCASDARVHFGLGTNAPPVTVQIHWPNGTAEEWKGIKPDQQILLKQGQGSKISAR